MRKLIAHFVRFFRPVQALLLLAAMGLLVLPSLAFAYTSTGMASYYAHKFHGRTTASGEKYNMWAMTCAHKTLPFGTMLKVTNLKNGKSVVVRVNDRGPYAKNRIIDLSKSAASKLDMIQSGVAKVKVEEVDKGRKEKPAKKPKKETPPEAANTEGQGFLTAKTYSLWGTEKFPEGWGIQVGAFKDLDNAKKLTKTCIAKGVNETYIQVGWQNNARIYRVLVGQYLDRGKAKKKVKFYKRHGLKGVPAKHFK